MSDYNISCSCSTAIFQIEKKWRTELVVRSCKFFRTDFSFLFVLSRNPVRDWLVGLSPAFCWWQCMLMLDQSNQMSCNTYVPFSRDRTQEPLVTVTRSILQLKPAPIWVTFSKCETAELIYCQTNVFVLYRLSCSSFFSVLPVLA